MFICFNKDKPIAEHREISDVIILVGDSLHIQPALLGLSIDANPGRDALGQKECGEDPVHVGLVAVQLDETGPASLCRSLNDRFAGEQSFVETTCKEAAGPVSDNTNHGYYDWQPA